MNKMNIITKIDDCIKDKNIADLLIKEPITVVINDFGQRL
jgi:hypothetical protein